MRSKINLWHLHCGLCVLFASGPAFSANELAIIKGQVVLCEESKNNCVAKTNISKSCKRIPKDECGKPRPVQLPPGDIVEISSLLSDSHGIEWLLVKSRYCIPDASPSGCTSTFSGWVKKVNVAYLKEFQRIKSWPHIEEFSVEAGDAAADFKINTDGTFEFRGCDTPCFDKFCDKGEMFSVGDIIWARLSSPRDYPEFIFTKHTTEDSYCWTSGGANRSHQTDGRRLNCFSSPFSQNKQ